MVQSLPSFPHQPSLLVVPSCEQGERWSRPEARKGWEQRGAEWGGGIGFINLCRKKRIYFGRWPPIPDPVSIEARCAKPSAVKSSAGCLVSSAIKRLPVRRCHFRQSLRLALLPTPFFSFRRPLNFFPLLSSILSYPTPILEWRHSGE